MIEFHETLPTLHQLKSQLVREAMRRSRGDMDCAAEILGLNRRSLLRYVIQEFNRIPDR